MECKFCNTENPEQAVFCKNCGKRLDGTTLCPACGGQIFADDAFCIFCGADVRKPAPTLIAEETAIAAAAGTADAPASTGASERNAQTAKKVLNYVANATAILTAVLALIFVFFIGTVSTVKLSGLSTETVSYGIKYFFKEGYEQLDKLKEVFDDLDGSISANYAPLIFGTVVLATAIIAVLVMTVKTIVCSVRNLMGKSEKNGCSLAIGAFMSFVFGAAMLLALTNGSTSTSETDISVKFNDETLTGIILCSVFAFISLGCKIAMRGRALLSKGEALKYGFAAGAVVLCAVMFGVCSAPYFKMTEEGESVRFSLVTIIKFAGIYSAANATGSVYDLIIGLTVISFAVLITFGALLMECILKNTENMQNGEDKKTLTEHIALVITSVILLILTIVIVCEFKKAIVDLDSDADGIKITYAVPIVLLVFSVLSLIENIVYRVISSRAANTAATVE